jgi:two-component system chemotaxis response regulator CheB
VAAERSDTVAKIRVLVVDDSFFMRKVIADILQADPDITVVGQAEDGPSALNQIAELHPDVVTLDLIMPGMDGLAVLKQLMQAPDHPGVLMVSAYTHEEADVTLECLSAGAVDFVLKPSESVAWALNSVAAELQTKVRSAAGSKAKPSPHPATAASAARARDRGTAARPSSRDAVGRAAIVIGASTGGPAALEQLLPQLPADLPFTVFVAQHLPSGFVESLVRRLNNISALAVAAGHEDEQVIPATIYFAPGDGDMSLVRDPGGAVTLHLEPSANILTPSVDRLMVSAAELYGAGTVGVILTGMGQDGLAGARAIKAAGGTILVQDEASSVVFGMGKAVTEQGLADQVVPLTQLPTALSRLKPHAR